MRFGNDKGLCGAAFRINSQLKLAACANQKDETYDGYQCARLHKKFFLTYEYDLYDYITF